jgi:hypothetical protein
MLRYVQRTTLYYRAALLIPSAFACPFNVSSIPKNVNTLGETSQAEMPVAK